MQRTAVTLGIQVAIQALGLITGILVARLLGPDGRGQVTMVIVWSAVITYVGDLGLPVAYTYASASEPARRRQLLANAIVITLVQWVLLAALGTIVLDLTLSKHGKALVELAAVYLWGYIPLNLVSRYANAVQQGADHYLAFNVTRLVVPLSYLAILLLMFGNGAFSVKEVILANLLSNVFVAVLAIALAVRFAGLFCPSEAVHWFDPSGLARDLRYGLAAHLGNLQPFNGLQLDVLVLTVLLSAHDLGLYAAALAGAAVLKAQGYAVGLMVLPEIARQRDPDHQRKLLARYIKGLCLLGGTIAAIAFLWAEPLIRFVYGAAFESAAPILRIMIVGGMASALYRVVADGLRGMGYPFSSTLAELVSMAVGIPALVVLGMYAGAEGAAIAVTIASSVALLLALFRLARCGLRVSDLADISWLARKTR